MNIEMHGKKIAEVLLPGTESRSPPELKPCPFCGQPLNVRWRKINPKANCATQDCWGGKLPVLQLDIPEFVAAWNTRSN